MSPSYVWITSTSPWLRMVKMNASPARSINWDQSFFNFAMLSLIACKYRIHGMNAKSSDRYSQFFLSPFQHMTFENNAIKFIIISVERRRFCFHPCWFVCLFICWSSRLFICLSVRLFVRMLYVCPYLSVCLFVDNIAGKQMNGFSWFFRMGWTWYNDYPGILCWLWVLTFGSRICYYFFGREPVPVSDIADERVDRFS